MTLRGRLERDLHPVAWWVWALGLAAATTRTTNPLMLLLVLGVVGFVVTTRRGDAPWAGGLKVYVVMGLVVIALRVVFRMLFDAHGGAHVLFTLPQLPLPKAAAGVRIGGPVALEGLLAATYDGLRLATLLLCLGAANVLANPRRLLKAMPSALYETGVAVTVALTVAPQLVESARRITRARRLRGSVGVRTRWFRQIVVPVLTDALDRSLLLAAAMDARGYGRIGAVSRRSRHLTGVLVLGGLVGISIGTYGLLDSTTPRLVGLPLLLSGTALAAGGLVQSGRRVPRTRYRPDRWRPAEWGVALTGVAVAVGVSWVAAADPTSITPSLQPLSWPPLPLGATAAILLGLLAAVLAPPPFRDGPARDHAAPGSIDVTGAGPAPSAAPELAEVAP